MKKLIAFLTAMAMLLSMTGCGAVGELIDHDVPEPDVDIVDDYDYDYDFGGGTDDAQPAVTTETVSCEIDLSKDEHTVVDNDKCLIRVEGVDPDSRFYGYTIKLYIENRSEDVNYTVNAEYTSVNGIMVYASLYEEVLAGKKVNTEMYFDDDMFEALEIDEYTDIEFTLTVVDSDDWSADDILHAGVKLYPHGKDKASSVTFDKSKISEPQYEDKNLFFAAVDSYHDSTFDRYTVVILIHNTSDYPINVGADNTSVNGYMIDPLFSCNIAPGKYAVAEMSWYDEYLEENGIDKIEDIEFTLGAYYYGIDYTDFRTIVEETVVINLD